MPRVVDAREFRKEMSVGGSRKLKASQLITSTYLNNKVRLLEELSKDLSDRTTQNNIRAYMHIVRAIEERYDLDGIVSPVVKNASVG
jgi:hypothetical protein